MKKLEGKVAVITGGSSGIGLATAKRFVEEGAHVVITGRREKELKEAATLIGKNVTTVAGDITRLEDLNRLYAVVKEKHGHIDALFANAGWGEVAPIGAATEAHFDKTFDLNAKGTFFTVQKAIPLFNDGGSIILTTSVANVMGLPTFAVYAATKAAVRSFVRSWAMELKEVLRCLVWVETTSGGRTKVELSSDEIDNGGEISNGAIAASLCLGSLYEAVDSLDETIGDLAMEPA
jgi:NAD(P)-dependent dehydrogenase (short-subunit alcohol dehydrogenase family)